MDKRRVVPEKFLDSTESGFFDSDEELETVLKQFTKTKHGFKRRPSIIEREQSTLFHSLKRQVPNKVQKHQITDDIHTTGQFESIEIPKYMFLPNSVFKRRWDLFIIILVLYNVVLIPMEIGLNVGESFPSYLIFLDYLIDSCFFLDIAINFRTPLIDEYGNLNTDQREIAVSYMKGWFWIDLIASLPLEIVVLIIGGGETGDLQLLSALKAPRLFRIGRILKYLENMPYANLMRIFRLFFFFFLTAHWVGCMWFLIKTHPTGHSDKEFEYKYVRTVYEGMLMLVGENVQPANEDERAFVMLIMFVAACFNASIFGNMAVLIQNMDKATSQYREKMDLINEYIHYENFPSSIVSEIRAYYDFLWLRQRSVMYDTDPFIDLSFPLKKALLLHQNRPLLTKTFIFEGCSPGFLEEIVLEMKPKLVMPRVMLTAEGDVGHEFYMIAKGSVDVTIAGNWMRRMAEGEFFGEIAVFMKSGRRTATVFSKSYCDLFFLSKTSLINLIFDFPADAEEMLQVAKYRFDNTIDQIPPDTLEKIYIDAEEHPWISLKPSELNPIRPSNQAYSSVYDIFSIPCIEKPEKRLMEYNRGRKDEVRKVQQELKAGRSIVQAEQRMSQLSSQVEAKVEMKLKDHFQELSKKIESLESILYADKNENYAPTN